MNLLYNIINKIKLFINKLTTFLKYRNVLINKVILPNRNKTVMDNNLNHRLMTDFVHINNHQNADFPFKYLFDFINSIDANEEFHFIKLTIKVQTCAFQTMCGKKHHNIWYESSKDNEVIVYLDDITVNLQDDELNTTLISYLSKIILIHCITYSISKDLGTSIDFHFTYEYIQLDEI